MNESTPQKISDIIKKIDNTNVVVSGLVKNYNTSDINNIKLINEAMQIANPRLTTNDLKFLSYSGILIPSKSVTIIVKVTMGNDFATKKVSMTANPLVRTNLIKLKVMIILPLPYIHFQDFHEIIILNFMNLEVRV